MALRMHQIPPQVGNYNIMQFKKRTGHVFNWFAAQDYRTGEIIDLKIVPKDELKKFNSVESTVAILHKIQKSESQSIIPIMKILEDENNIYIAQEKLPNGTLADHVHKVGRKIRSSTFIRWGREILEGINALHSVGITLNDIRLENMGLDVESHIRINDFSICPQANLSSQDQNTKESPIFVAPEIIKDERAVSSKADIWAFGILMHYLVTGQYPFNYINMKIYYENIDNPTYYKPKCKGLFAELMTLTLQINPVMRCTTDELLNSHIFSEDKFQALAARRRSSPSLAENLNRKSFITLSSMKTQSKIELSKSFIGLAPRKVKM